MKGMETLQDLIEEAKLRTVWWGLCIFAVSYFLTHTSKSMWMNIPISVLIVFGLRILFNEVEFHWKVRSLQRKTNLSHLEKKQLSVNDFRLTTLPPPPKRKRKIDSPIIEAAIEDFVNKLLQDFVTDLWYSAITPDKEAPELIHAIVMDVLADVSGRVKEINLVELLTRDVVNLIGDHIDLFRRNQTLIGVDVMKTLSSEERDERLKHQLRASKEIHPALVSPDCEYKVLQRLMSGVLAVALRPREAQSPLIRCIARELLTCLVMQPLINLASPEYINELIEYIYIAMKDEGLKQKGDNQSDGVDGQMRDHVVCTNSQYGIASMKKNASLASHVSNSTLSRYDNASESLDASSTSHDESLLYRSAEWARPLEAATQRRTEVLMPENLENMWTKGRNYKKKVQKASAGVHALGPKGSEINSALQSEDTEKKLLAEKPEYYTIAKNKYLAHAPSSPIPDSLTISEMENAVCLSREPDRVESFKEVYKIDEFNDTASPVASGNKKRLKRSNSTPDLVIQPNMDTPFTSKFGGPVISEFYSPDSGGHNQLVTDNSASDIVLSSDGNTPKLKCRVIGAYFEKLGSKSFAVYSIAVTDTENNTWFVKRRYRNFERLHRHLKDIPNYTLQLPPKRIFSSSTEDKFVRQRCIQLDKYLQDLLSIANVAEQHEVWDFLSVSSKNYSFGKSPSVMRTLAVNVDDAVDDIVRQVKGVSGGLMRKVVGPSSTAYEQASLISAGNLSRKEDEIKNVILRQQTADSAYSFSDDEECDQAASNISQRPEGWQSDNKLKSKDILRFGSDKHASRVKSESISSGANLHLEDLTRVPQEWTPPNLSVPVLNLVDNIFQLKRRGWLRRQVFWISKQIVQLMMEDAIDDWLLRQIHWFRRDDIIAQGIRWVQDVLWPDGIFFLPLTTASVGDDCEPNTRGLQITSHSASNKVSKQGSFEEQIEAVRRASDVRKILFDEVPIALVSLIGHNQYKRCAHDIYYFLQSKVCMKQLTYGILELVLVSIFPELREVVLDMHEKMRDQSG